jgi:NAD(P)-dependent dehydrogenase (short-subunit alcohol dehydrogenase family)
MVNVLIIGATRGLGAALANAYASDSSNTVFGTTRSAAGPSGDKCHKAITWVPHIDLMNSGVGASLANQLGMLGVSGGMVEGGVKHLDIVVRHSHLQVPPFSTCTDRAQIITAGYFATEDFTNGPKWDEEIKMYSL